MRSVERRVGTFAFIGARLILVKTIGVGARIPPKGKAEPGETDVEAVVRELREEAGVTRTPRYVSEWPIARYEHVKARSGRNEIHYIYAALIDEKDFAPEQAELGRKPKLFTLEEAVAQVHRDVADGLRPSHSGNDLIAAIGTAFAFVSEMREGRAPLHHFLLPLDLGARLREWIALQIGLAQPAIAKIENGEQSISWNTLHKIAKVPRRA